MRVSLLAGACRATCLREWIGFLKLENDKIVFVFSFQKTMLTAVPRQADLFAHSLHPRKTSFFP
jgi:hypothetical protein